MDNRIKVQCLECGKKWKTASSLPQCSRCNSVDIEPIEEPITYASKSEDFGGAFDGNRVISDADGGL